MPFSADITLVGELLICAVLVCAAFTWATALAAIGNRPHYLTAVRCGTYATCALVASATFLLAYAFQVHDFRIQYVAQYSDRSMSWPLLLGALWGGQDGSLLAWTFALSACIAVCTARLRERLLALQPIILATLMSVVAFFAVVMLFAANPFSASFSATPVDGRGLNPLLHSFWMLIHPPVLYVGMVAWAIPFSFVVAALITDKPGDVWMQEVRPYVIFAWIALATGNVLGMIWSYEELGWGGYWAWDPVENASFLPMLAGTAYLHSAAQEQRRSMFRVWNPALLCLAFFLTIFGTFLTRSGLISSVHAFARSGMGIYFVAYMLIIAAVSLGVILWRLRGLKSSGKMESAVSRDFALFATHWLMMGMLAFVVVATLFPLITQVFSGQTVTVGPSLYNRWTVPLGLFLMALLAVCPLLAQRRSSVAYLRRTLPVPALVATAVAILHLVFGSALGFPATIASHQSSPTALSRALVAAYGAAPVISTTLCAFALAGHLQEFWRGTASHMRRTGTNALASLWGMMAKARRRYGGYVVHMGFVLMCFGFTGAAYDSERQASLRPGESVTLRGYSVRFDGPRMQDDLDKRMLLADMTVLRDGETVGHVTPARFFYGPPTQATTTEVAILSMPREDVYVILNGVNPESNVGTFRVLVRPFVAWIWIGFILALAGALICLGPWRTRMMS